MQQARSQINGTEFNVPNPLRPSTGRQGKVLSGQVEASYKGQLDYKRSSGIQNSLCTGSTSNSAGSLCLQAGGDQDHIRGDTVSFKERSHPCVQRPGRLHKQYILGTQERREVETNFESEVIELVCEVRALQNGRHSVCERSHQQGRLHVQAGPRRFPHCREQQGGRRSSFSEDQGSIAESWICDKSRKITEPSNPKNRVSGVHYRLERDDIPASSGKSEADQRRMQKESAEGSGDSERAGTHSGCTSSYSPGSFTSSPALLCTTGPEERRSLPPPLVRIDSDSKFSESEEPPVVDQTPQQGEWKATPPTTSQHDHRIGCVKYRVGSPLWIAEDSGQQKRRGCISTAKSC